MSVGDTKLNVGIERLEFVMTLSATGIDAKVNGEPKWLDFGGEDVTELTFGIKPNNKKFFSDLADLINEHSIPDICYNDDCEAEGCVGGCYE